MAIVPEQPHNAAATPPPTSTPTAITSATTPTPPAAAAPTPSGGRRVHPAVWRLALLALLFAGWMGYLGYLVARRTLTPAGAPLVVSRAQILVAEYAVVAQVDKVDAPVTVKEVLWLKDPNLPVREGDSLKVSNLDDCRPFPPRAQDDAQVIVPPLDFDGPGLYLLLLRKSHDGYEVARVPFSPGYPPGDGNYRQGQPRIYPIKPGSSDVVDQFKAAAKPRPIEEGNAP